MIAAVDAQGWVPHGRSLGHPGRLMEPQHGSIDPLADQFRSIDLSEETKEFWLLRACPGKHGDDELYARGRTVIWSRGAHSRWQTMRSFTLESSVVAVCWATFHPSPSIHQPELQNTEASFEGIFMADSKNISVYGIDGQDYITSSQFPVSSVWPTHIGILIERKINSTSAEISTLQLPLVYSLQHPYDDIKPIITKKTGQIGAITQPGQQVLFTNIEPPICVLYDATTGLHSAWTIRKATEQESLAPNEASTEISVNDSIFPSASFYTSPTASFRAVSTVHTDRSSTTRHPSLAESLGGGQSFDSYWRRDSSLEMRSPLCCDAPEGPLYPVFPEVCLDHLWTDTNRSGSASRVFLNTDLVGIVRLCYMVPSCGHLFMIKVEQTNQQEQILFGSKIALPALDAVTFTDVPMVLILEKGGCLALYSGCQLVTKVLVPCGIESVPILSPPTADTPSTYSFYSALTSPKQASSSFKWRRSSLRPECSLDGSYFGNTSCALSPVLPGQASLLPVVENKLLENTSSEIVRLRDPTGRSVTLEYKGGRTVRISLPEMHSSYLVARVVSVLRSALMREEANILLAKWYCVRNAPGSQNIDEDTEWHLFMTALLGLLGYDVDHLTLVTDRGLCGDVPAMPEEKKKRISDEGTFEDWKWMIQKYKDGLNDLDQLLGLDCLQQQHILHRYRGTINSDAPLFLKFSKVLYSLHLLYEDMKLDMLARPSLPLLAPFLHLLALDLQETERADLFWRDFPLLCKRREGQMTPESLAKLARPENLLAEHDVPHILSFLQCVIGTETDKLQPYPYVQSINSYSRNVIQAVSFPALGRDASNRMLSDLTPSLEDPLPDTKAATFQSVPADTKFVERSISIMIDKGLSMDKLQQLPPSLALMCLAVTRICHEPPPGWSAEAYQLVSRQDLAELKNQTCGLPSKIPAVQSKKLGPYPASNGSEVPEEVEDGMEGLDMEVLSLRFPKDQRIQSVRRMLQSSRPVRICMTQRPEVSDHDFIEEQERHLYAVCTRTMALPVGRGMFTLGTIKPNVLEPLPVPRLCLTGRSPTRGTTVDLSHIEVVPNMNLWPLFHNGVAAGLRVCPNAVGIDSTWIAYNKQKGNADTQTEHAGFLMALGLNGHLSSLNNFKIYEYLQKCHEMTSIGLLLGIAASKRGSSDQEMSQTIRTVCLHIEAMLPPTSLELNIAQNIQVAALLCLGLLYQGSAHRHITEVLLSEIGRPPGPEMDNCVDRESYSLAAGLALGLVVLGQGAAPMADLRDLAIPDTLHHYMIGGHARQLAGSQRDKYRTPSYQIREGDAVNIHVTCPGATLALGMLYFRTGNQAVASWMKPPDTQYLLDFIRPDFLMLRVLARGLILWDDIMPTTEWVESNIPPSIHPDVWSRPAFDEDNKFDLETMNQAYNNILAGACLALGMRFAGTSNKTAFDTIYYYVSHFISMLGRSSAEIAGKSTIECCTNVAMLSAALVMAGTGDLHCVRLIRMLRSRVGSAHPVVTYGSHLATHMALGLLFLGGGRYTLSTSPPAIAAMLCAFFPKFPTHSNDNRYHLQAFRHLYVLAAEPRLLLPRCVDTGICDYCMLQLHYKDTPWYKDQSVVVQAPYLLPELKLLNKVQVGDSRYWTITFERDRNWEQLKKMLREMRCLPVKRCAGCLPHVEDPKGFRTLYAQSLSDCTDLCGSTWSIQLETILSFSKSSLVDLARLFLTENPPGESLSEKMHKKRLSALTYECCVQDKSSSLQFVLAILHVLERLEQGKLEPLSIWDVKILQQVTMLIQYEPYKAVKAIVSKEASHSLYGRTRTIIDGYEKDILPLMAHYLKGDDMIIINDRTALLLATYLTFYDIPTPKALACVPRPWNHVSLMTHKILAPAADKLVTWQELGVLNM